LTGQCLIDDSNSRISLIISFDARYSAEMSEPTHDAIDECLF
jgi:hypothetical protein